LPGDHPDARSAAARVPATARRPDGGNFGAGGDEAEVAKAERAAHHAAASGGAARVQSHAGASRVPAGDHVSGDHGDAGARDFRGRGGGGEGRREGEAGGDDPAGRHAEGDGEPGSDRAAGGGGGLRGEGDAGGLPGGHDDRAAAGGGGSGGDRERGR